MKIKQWKFPIIILGIVSFFFALLPWFTNFQKYLVLFILIFFGLIKVLYNAIKSRNTISIVIQVLVTIILFFLMFLILMRYY